MSDTVDLKPVRTRAIDRYIFAGGSLSWAIAQWFLVWLFARVGDGAAAVGQYSLTLAIVTPVFIIGSWVCAPLSELTNQFHLEVVSDSAADRHWGCNCHHRGLLPD